jgi:UDP-N-acetylglucosamine acyltransferase
MTDLVHPTAVIGPEVELAPDVQVGPFTILEGAVRIGAGSVIESHACVTGPLVMGRNNLVSHGAVLGKSPQSRGYRDEATTVLIGDENQFREHVTVHRGTAQGRGATVIGDRNMFMVNSHVGHDARIGNDCTLVNGALLAGHVELADGCILSSYSAVQQRVRMGRLAMISGFGASTKDIPPFILQQGYNTVLGLNLVGLRRARISASSIDALKVAFRILYCEGRLVTAALERIEADHGSVAEVVEFVGFIRQSTNGINAARDTSRRDHTF